MQKHPLIIIPTYNEATNVIRMIHTLMALDMKVDILFVDDGSPDGTAERIKEQQHANPDRGFEYALEHDYELVCEMDADFSHPPEDVSRLIEAVQSRETDIAIGSRYANGISIVNWPLSRLILSYGANIYARWITGLPVKDTTAGFKCIHRRVIESISLDRIKSNGYAFQIELHFRAWKAGFRLQEVSIIFREREEGVSKMSKGIVREAIWRVWALKIRSLFGRL